MAGLGLALNDRRRRIRGAGGVASVIASIDADGWQANYNGTPPSTTLNEPLTMNAPGFTSTGTATTRTISTGFRTTRRLRNPGLTTLQATKVGLSLKVPQGATIAGVTNNSTATVPKPIVNWVSRHQRVIGNEDVVLEVVCGHYYAGTVAGEQVACVEFVVTSSGGGATITKRTSTQVASTYFAGDKKTIYVYTVTITAAEMATLNDGRISYHCNVFPFVGVDTGVAATTSVARTTDASARGFPTWKFAERYDIKDVTRRTNIPRCYLDTAGNDTTGRWSPNDATAASLPFATMAGALAAARLAADIPAGSFLAAGTVDGCEIRARAGTFVLGGSGASAPNAGAALIITRDPAVSKANAIYSHTASTPRLRVGQTGVLANCEAAMAFVDITYTRTANVNQTTDATTTNLYYIDVSLGYGGFTSPISNASTRQWHYGTTVSGVLSGGSALAPTSGGAVGIWRGCSGNVNGAFIFGYNMHGCQHSNVGAVTAASYAMLNPDNMTCTNNINNGDQGATYAFDTASLGQTITGVLIMGNVNEWTSIATNPSYRISSDAGLGNTVHILEYHNSYTGFDTNGRHNDRYVDTDATGTRTHVWGRDVNNIRVSYNTKHDLLPPANAARVGGWEVEFGVGKSCNWQQFQDAGAGGNAPNYVDPGDWTSPDQSTRNPAYDPLFKVNGGTINNTTPGPGGGDYRLQRISEGDAANSPCLSRAELQLLPGFGTVIGAYP